ncbi:hypothetical protein EJ06DRAFT_548183 [Trichodelitschia bisporula]|uniref:Uncharacterized protein n=1 Tax=Trichodelitschia bisporula TaxID=703511 RepID=A0A6G1I145_9PEZI|nr:hypothetical protein EJ06DRAFT_548183 [Trichodelitschia bisporula]
MGASGEVEVCGRQHMGFVRRRSTDSTIDACPPQHAVYRSAPPDHVHHPVITSPYAHSSVLTRGHAALYTVRRGHGASSSSVLVPLDRVARPGARRAPEGDFIYGIGVGIPEQLTPRHGDPPAVELELAITTYQSAARAGSSLGLVPENRGREDDNAGAGGGRGLYARLQSAYLTALDRACGLQQGDPAGGDWGEEKRRRK